MKSWTVTTLLAACYVIATASYASAQGIICCDHHIYVNGNWVGASRKYDCQNFIDKAPKQNLRLMCKERQVLSCIDTSRCDTLRPKKSTKQTPTVSETLPAK